MVRAYPLQTHEMLFGALAQTFRMQGGVPLRRIFENIEDRRRLDRLRQGAPGQSPLCRPGESLPIRTFL